MSPRTSRIQQVAAQHLASVREDYTKAVRAAELRPPTDVLEPLTGGTLREAWSRDCGDATLQRQLKALCTLAEQVQVKLESDPWWKLASQKDSLASELDRAEQLANLLQAMSAAPDKPRAPLRPELEAPVNEVRSAIHFAGLILERLAEVDRKHSTQVAGEYYAEIVDATSVLLATSGTLTAVLKSEAPLKELLSAEGASEQKLKDVLERAIPVFDTETACSIQALYEPSGAVRPVPGGLTGKVVALLMRLSSRVPQTELGRLASALLDLQEAVAAAQSVRTALMAKPLLEGSVSLQEANPSFAEMAEIKATTFTGALLELANRAEQGDHLAQSILRTQYRPTDSVLEDASALHTFAAACDGAGLPEKALQDLRRQFDTRSPLGHLVGALVRALSLSPS